MERQEVYNAVSNIVKEISGWTDIKLMNENTNLRMIGIDSLDKVELLMDIETKFQIIITDQEIGGIENVGHIVNIVLKKIDDGNTAPTTGN
jgi:acyl carrier protein